MSKSNLKLISSSFGSMGTEVNIDIVLRGTLNEEKARESISKIKKIFSQNEKIFSRFDSKSELSKINENVGQEISVSQEMIEVLESCKKFHKISGGFFDPRIIDTLESTGYIKDFRKYNPSSDKNKKLNKFETKNDLDEDLIVNKRKKTIVTQKRIDTTGIVKGYTVDIASEYLKKEGYDDFVVDAGGDMYAKGKNKNGKKWRIGIEGLDDDSTMLTLQDEAIATSGISRKQWQLGDKRVHHLINPKDPENFSHEIKTVTVIEREAFEADGRAKSLFLMGAEEGIKFANKNSIKALFLDYKGNIYVSKQIKENLL